MVLLTNEVQRFCMHDGPGVRTVIFLKGCPLRCAWCHNPETQEFRPQLLFYAGKCIGCQSCAACPHGAHTFGGGHRIERTLCDGCGLCERICPAGALELCGKEREIGELLAEAERDSAFYGETGGVTLSGGEPFAQKEAVLALLQACREKRISTAVETCGFFDAALLPEAVPLVDLFLWDVKDTDSIRHKEYTGVPNDMILSNLAAADRLGAKTRLRCILVNGVNTDTQHYDKLARLAGSLSHCEGIEFIPYHAYGGSKATFLGNADSGRKEWIPTAEQLEAAKARIGSYVFNR